MIVDRMKKDVIKKLEDNEEEDEEFFQKAWKVLTNNYEVLGDEDLHIFEVLRHCTNKEAMMKRLDEVDSCGTILIEL